MPIFFHHDIDEGTKLAIWKIEEEEDFFLKEVPLQKEITHPHKRLQHLAGRYLLRYLFPGFPIELIKIADTRKPYLENEAYHFSVSHCGAYAAAIVSKQNRVGIDIEIVSPKIEKVRHKFLGDAEIAAISDIAATEWGLTLLWSGKEACFKWYGLGGVDFKRDMQVRSIALHDNKYGTIIMFNKEKKVELNIQSCFFNSLCLSYIVT